MITNASLFCRVVLPPDNPSVQFPAVVEYTPLASAEKWRVEKFEQFATEFEFTLAGGHADLMTVFHTAALAYPRGWELARRLFGIGAAVLFNGSGFYETDYRSESYKSAARAESDAAKPAEASKPDTAGKADGSSAPKADSASKPAKKTSKSKE